MPSQCIFITGLRRSGTTILWETLRRDGAVSAYDEPFHPRLWSGARQNAKGTWDELGAYWQAVRPDETMAASPITPLDELASEAAPGQVRYLQSLMQSAGQTAIDSVRAWNKVAALVPRAVEVTVVHLMRSPVHWVAAHLLPSGAGTWKKALADRYRRQSFFTRKGFYNNWQYEEIIDAALAREHPMWAAVKIAPEALAREPAHVKLLAFWWAANLTTYRQLRSTGMDRVCTLTLEDFTAAPEAAMQRLYAAAGWPGPVDGFRLDHVGAVRAAWKADAPAWGSAAARLGLPAGLVGPDGLAAGFVEDALASTVAHDD